MESVSHELVSESHYGASGNAKALGVHAQLCVGCTEHRLTGTHLTVDVGD